MGIFSAIASMFGLRPHLGQIDLRSVDSFVMAEHEIEEGWRAGGMKDGSPAHMSAMSRWGFDDLGSWEHARDYVLGWQAANVPNYVQLRVQAQQKVLNAQMTSLRGMDMERATALHPAMRFDGGARRP